MGLDRSPHRAFLACSLLVGFPLGCRPPAGTPAGPASVIVFEGPTHDFGVVRGGSSPLELKVPFRVIGDRPVVIDAIHRSCGCTTVEGLIGQALQPGRGYTLPLSITLRPSSAMGVSVELVERGTLLGSLFLHGVVEGEPQAIPSSVRAEIGDSPGASPSGEFVVGRVRSPKSPPLVPLVDDLRGGPLSARLVGREELKQATGNPNIPYLVNDRLTWRWTLDLDRPIVESETIGEPLRIAWKGGVAEPTRVDVVLTRTPPLRGILNEIRCGTLPPGAVWSYTMTLRESGRRRPKVARVHCDTPGVSAQVKDVGTALALVKFTVQAPDTTGEFRSLVEIEFEDRALRPIRIPIVGFVAR